MDMGLYFDTNIESQKKNTANNEDLKVKFYITDSNSEQAS